MKTYAQDSSGNNRHGTLFNVELTEGVAAGSDFSAEFQESSSISLFPGTLLPVDFGFSTFFHTNLLSDSQYQALFSQFSDRGLRLGFGVEKGQLTFMYTDMEGESHKVIGTTRAASKHHAFLNVVEVSTNTFEVYAYLDGQLQFSVSNVLLQPRSGRKLVLGSDYEEGQFYGQLDESFFTSDILTGRQIEYLAAVGLGVEPIYRQWATISDDNMVISSVSGSMTTEVSQTPFSTEEAFEVEFSIEDISGLLCIGACTSSFDTGLVNNKVGSAKDSVGYFSSGEIRYTQSDPTSPEILPNLNLLSSGDSLRIQYDPNTGQMTFWSVEQFLGVVTLDASKVYYPAVSLGSGRVKANFGQQTMSNTAHSTGFPQKKFSALSSEILYGKFCTSLLFDKFDLSLVAGLDAEVGAANSLIQGLPAITEDEDDLAVRLPPNGPPPVITVSDAFTADNFSAVLVVQPGIGDLEGSSILMHCADDTAPGWIVAFREGLFGFSFNDTDWVLSEKTLVAGYTYLLAVRVNEGVVELVINGETVATSPAQRLGKCSQCFIGASSEETDRFSGKVSHIVLHDSPIQNWRLKRMSLYIDGAPVNTPTPVDTSHYTSPNAQHTDFEFSA